MIFNERVLGTEECTERKVTEGRVTNENKCICIRRLLRDRFDENLLKRATSVMEGETIIARYRLIGCCNEQFKL